MYPNDGFRELGRQESLRLMAKVSVGRIVFTRQALPAVLPVNFSLDDADAVLLRTSATSDLVRAIDGAVVAFEADDVDAGWQALRQWFAGPRSEAWRERVYDRLHARWRRDPASRESP